MIDTDERPATAKGRHGVDEATLIEAPEVAIETCGVPADDRIRTAGRTGPVRRSRDRADAFERRREQR